MRYGLIGDRLGHSYSKLIHERMATYKYDLIPLTQEEFLVFMEKKEFNAINVTIPYKQAVLPYLDEIHPLAKTIGAVNTIVNKGGRLYGFNTDFYGFEYMLKANGILVEGKKCIILGNGGTSQTVQSALTHLGAESLLVVSRTPKEPLISYEDCYQKHKDAQIIVNTTPIGMYPKQDASPLDLTSFDQCEAVVDVIFNPTPTLLTKKAEELGMKAVNGLEMLVAQAKQAVEYFLDIELEDNKIYDVYKELLEII